MNQPEGQTPEFDAIWENTLAELEKSNEKLFENCPPSVRQFIDNFIFLNMPAFSRSILPNNDEYVFVIGSPENGEIYFLGYELTGEIKKFNHHGEAFDANAQAVWLYDEFHAVDNHFEHHVIFSDGTEYIIPFIFFHTRKTKWFEE